MELYDNPGIIILDDNKIVRTTKIKKYITKNKINYKDIKYLENVSTDFREVERSLKELENNYLGLGPLKEKQQKDEIKINYEKKYLFWDKHCKGWLISNNKNVIEWPWQDEIGTRFIYIGYTNENEEIVDVEKRLYKNALKF